MFVFNFFRWFVYVYVTVFVTVSADRSGPRQPESDTNIGISAYLQSAVVYVAIVIFEKKLLVDVTSVPADCILPSFISPKISDDVHPVDLAAGKDEDFICFMHR